MQEFYERWVKTEVAVGHVRNCKRIEDDAQLECNVTLPTMPNFEGELVVGYAASAMQAGLISKRRATEMIGEDPDVQEEQIHKEEEMDAERYGQAPNGVSGVSGTNTSEKVHDPDTGHFVTKDEEGEAERRKSEKTAQQATESVSGNGHSPERRWDRD